ncbi:hypothetical protein IC235_08285 [Hymenobacter sp. BT664]|uniref:Uncharacterized protein n=1 Tax=Hymenobacter montanus TaxID=2771359 RepID=A0A927GIZ9_9BACT|nr:hypothetical protein [Hymenobacter montanus]MBD2767890.1 hypothetical protein [Hymenobacter montanus]
MAVALSSDASKAQIIAFIDRWVSLLVQKKYDEVLALIVAEPGWRPALIEEVSNSYGDAANRVTLLNNGTALDGAGNSEIGRPRKEVDWHDDERGDVWYDLNINGLSSDLTATFDLVRRAGRMHLILQDIHVM